MHTAGKDTQVKHAGGSGEVGGETRAQIGFRRPGTMAAAASGPGWVAFSAAPLG